MSALFKTRGRLYRMSLKKSGFLDPCERSIRQARETLSAGHVVRIQLNAEKRGYPGRLVVEIRADDGSNFGSDFSYSDVTRFPQRIRVAATALYICGCWGRFLVTHLDGTLEISQT